MEWCVTMKKCVMTPQVSHRPLSRRLDRCDRVIQNESRDPFGGNVYYVTMQITLFTRTFRNGERNLHCDVVHITTKWVSSLTLDCNGVFAIKAYSERGSAIYDCLVVLMGVSCYRWSLWKVSLKPSAARYVD